MRPKKFPLPSGRLRHIICLWAVYSIALLSLAEVFQHDSKITKWNHPYFLHGLFEESYYRPPLGKWDAIWYAAIARDGYLGKLPASKYTAAFYPLYPIFMRATSEVTLLDLFHAGILVSVLFLLAFLIIFEIYLRKVCKQDDQECNATLLLFLLFPATFICLSAYYMSLFIFLTVGTFLFVRIGKTKWAFLFAFLAGLTHMHSLCLGIALSCYALQSRKKRDWLPPLAVGLATGLLMLHNYYFFNDAFYYITTKKLFAGEFRNPFKILNQFTEIFVDLFKIRIIGSVGNLLTMLSFLCSLATAIWMLVKKRSEWLPEAIFVLALCAIQISTGTTWGFLRFSLVLFPVFAWWGAKLYGRPTAFSSIVILSAFAQITYLIHWITEWTPAP